MLSEISVRLTREGDLPEVMMEVPCGDGSALVVLGPVVADRLGTSLRNAAAHCLSLADELHSGSGVTG